ncbi:MAG: histidine phosphatase family protein [Sneathiella sp.]
MRKLTLLRHAKSSWTDHARADIDRPLTSRGRRGALKIGSFMADNGIFPDLILCSPSRRTRETLSQINPFLPDGTEVQIEKSIYSAGHGDGLICYLKSSAIEEAHVMIIGHNPTMQQMALNLATPSAENGYSRIEAKYPTAALTQIKFEIDDWSQLKGRGELLHFVTPKMLPGLAEEEED